MPKRWPGCEGAALALVTPSVRLRSEGRRRRCLPGLFPAPSRRRAPRALPPGPPFRAGASRPPRQAQRGPRVRHGENGSGALPPQQQPPSPLLLALDPGSRRLRRSPRRPAASAPALRWSKGPGVRREACPAWTPPGPLLCAPAPPGGASAAGHAARAQAARRAAGLDRAPIASGAPSRGRLGRTRSLISVSLRSASLRDGGGAPRPHVWEDCFSFTNLHGFWLLLWPVVLLRFLPNFCKFAIVPWLLTNLDPEFLFNREPLVSKCLQ